MSTPLPSALLHHLRLQHSNILHVLDADLLRTATTDNHFDQSYGVRYGVYLYNSSVLFSIQTRCEGVRAFSKFLSGGNNHPSPVLSGVPAQATGQCILLFSWELVLYNSSMAGSGPEGGCTVTPQDVGDEHLFNLDLVVQLGSASDESDNVVEV